MSFLKNELNDLAYASRNQNTRVHYSRYVTEGGAKMLIRRFRNNETRAFRKYWQGTKFRVINSKAIMISPRELQDSSNSPGVSRVKILVTYRTKHHYKFLAHSKCFYLKLNTCNSTIK